MKNLKIKLTTLLKEYDSDSQSDLIVKKIQTFDWRKETVQMLGRWQPSMKVIELFKKVQLKTGQVVIQVRDCQNWDESNPLILKRLRKI